MFDFTILALPGAFGSGVGAVLDILSNASKAANKSGCAFLRWRVCSTVSEVVLSNGLRVDATLLPETPRADRSIWFVPGLDFDCADSAEKRLSQPDVARAVQAVGVQAHAGGTVAAACSAVFMLQRAGLLAGKRVTTTWWLGSLLQRLEPECHVDIDQMVISDGNIVTGGAAFAHIDLVLHLLRTHFNPSLADTVSRTVVVDGRRLQSPYIMPTVLAGGNEIARRLVARFETGFPNPPTVTELAAEFGMSNRTLSRHVKEATGRSILALLQSVRVNRARMLLQTSRMSVEMVAAQVGYTDTTALRRLMRKVTHSTPSHFRSAVFEDLRHVRKTNSSR